MLSEGIHLNICHFQADARFGRDLEEDEEEEEEEEIEDQIDQVRGIFTQFKAIRHFNFSIDIHVK